MVLVANLAAKDMGSTTGINLSKLAKETDLNPWKTSSYEVRTALEQSDVMVPEMDRWRLPFLEKLLLQRHNMQAQIQNTKKLQDIIDSLCSS